MPNSDTRWVEKSLDVLSRPDLDIVQVFEAGQRFGTRTEHVISTFTAIMKNLSGANIRLKQTNQTFDLSSAS